MKAVTVTLNPCTDKTVEIENFEAGKTNRVLSLRTDIGGKGINVSRMLNSFGIPSVATGILSGETGIFIERELIDAGISTDFIFGVGETRTNLKIHDTESKVLTEINESGAPAGESYEEFRRKIMGLLQDCEILILSGSVPRDVGSSAYAELISYAKHFGVSVILDAEGELLRRGIEAVPFAVKPNKDELEQLAGRKLCHIDEVIAEAKNINKAGVELVVVSLGEDGAVFVRDSLVIRTKPFPIEVKSSAAAGDSMVGALVYALEQELTLTQTAKIMTAAGTITAGKEGTQVATFGEIAANFDRVKAEIIDVGEVE